MFLYRILVVWLTASHLFLVAAFDPNAQFALSFTPTTIVVSQYDSLGSVKTARYPAGEEYLSYFNDTLELFELGPGFQRHINSGTRQASESTTKMFRKTVLPVTDTLTVQLGQVPSYATLFMPPIFGPFEREAATEAVLRNSNAEAHLASPARKAASHVYDSLGCKHLGRPLHDCVDEGPPNLVILLEYEKEYLFAHLLIVDFEFQDYPPILEESCRRCGEAFQNMDAEESHEIRIEEFLQEFMVKTAQSYSLDSVRAILVSGEANATSELSQKTRQILDNDVARVMTLVAPSDMVPYGAAWWARWVQQEPWVFIIPTVDTIGSHDEL